MILKTIYNGVCIDDVIEGFRTLNVIGRENPSINNSFKENVYDGKRLIKSRLNGKDIEVEYLMKCPDGQALKESFDQLNKILVREESQIVFSDEDKYWIGVFDGNEFYEEGLNGKVGRLTFSLTDAKKYALEEKEFIASVNDDGIIECVFENDGNVPVPISYEIIMNHENGYIGIASKDGAMQYGLIDEADTETGQRSEMLINKTSGVDIYNAGALNQGIFTSAFDQNGTFTTDGNYLAVNNVGSGASYHGAGLKINVPNDSMNRRGAQNFKLQSKVWYELNANKQTGIVEIAVADENDEFMCAFYILKTATTNATAKASFKASNKVVKTVSYTANNKGKTNEKGAEIVITKQGEKFSCTFPGSTYSYNAPELADKKACSVSVFIGNYKALAQNVKQMKVGSIKFTKNNVEYEIDVPNRYAQGSVIKIDGNEGHFYVNGNRADEDEIIGTTYFDADVGENVIWFSNSDFSVPAPTYKVKIREEWM